MSNNNNNKQTLEKLNGSDKLSHVCVRLREQYLMYFVQLGILVGETFLSDKPSTSARNILILGFSISIFVLLNNKERKT